MLQTLPVLQEHDKPSCSPCCAAARYLQLKLLHSCLCCSPMGRLQKLAARPVGSPPLINRLCCRYVNTTAVKSCISFIDGDKGILRYRGYPIEQLAEHSSFLEVGCAPRPPLYALACRASHMAAGCATTCLLPFQQFLNPPQEAHPLVCCTPPSSKHIASSFPASAHNSWLRLGLTACLPSPPAGCLPAGVRQPAQQSGAGALGGGSRTSQRRARGCGECDRGVAP